MNHQIQESIQAGVEFLAKRQEPSGAFKGYSGGRKTETIFFTALISCCLTNVKNTLSIRSKAAQYLLLHKNDTWSWNYWERGSNARPYPDDLDDTSCAIAALTGSNSNTLSADSYANVAKVLISCEVKPGGPYRTWLVSPREALWSDVDPAVNANIGYMLACLGVHSKPLEDYASNCIRIGKLQSPYYIGIVPTLYFMSRWYRGSMRDRLRDIIIEQLEKPEASLLEKAMLITALCNLGCRNLIDSRLVGELLDSQSGGRWPAQPLYFEPPESGRRRYAESAGLTTAFAVEALSAYSRHLAIDLSLTEPHQPSEAAAIYKELIRSQSRPEIINVAGIVARAGCWRIKESTIRHLNKASRNGWLAYTIYDDFLDEEGEARYLSVANMAMRRSVGHFNQAIDSPVFNGFVEDVFNQVDAANTWEVVHARDPQHPPSYGAYARLAQRSWGHVIAPTGVLLAAGFSLGGAEVKRLHDFFRHYIIAKQLCDDAHDWLDDLRKGHVTAVVALLLQECPKSDDASRQLHFWQRTIDQVNVLVREHINRARHVLIGCEFLPNQEVMLEWLDSLEAVCTQADQGRGQALKFIQTFTSSNLVK